MGIGNEAQEAYNVVKIKLEMINKEPDNNMLSGFLFVERETRFELATFSLEG